MRRRSKMQGKAGEALLIIVLIPLVFVAIVIKFFIAALPYILVTTFLVIAIVIIIRCVVSYRQDH